MTDLKSTLGYARYSPYRNNPYLDIYSEEGTIDMENTDMDLLGIDNLGNIKKMKARSKKLYKFPGTQIREIPMQAGGNVFKTQAEIDAANMYAKNLFQRRGYPVGQNAYVARKIGDPKPTFLVPPGLSGRIVPTNRDSVPSYVQRSDIQTNQGIAYYTDPQTGEAVEISMDVLNSPRFKKPMQTGGMIPNAGYPGISPNNYLQRGGYASQIFKYIFSEDEQPVVKPNINTIEPAITEETPPSLYDKYAQEQADFDSAMSVLLDNNEDIFSNPYGDTNLNYD